MEQVNVGSSGSGAATQVDIQLSNTSGSMVLHWGVICESQGYVQYQSFQVIWLFIKCLSCFVLQYILLLEGDLFPLFTVSRKWVLPSRRPDGTQVYKNRALRTHFAKVSSNNNYERKKVS